MVNLINRNIAITTLSSNYFIQIKAKREKYLKIEADFGMKMF